MTESDSKSSASRSGSVLRRFLVIVLIAGAFLAGYLFSDDGVSHSPDRQAAGVDAPQTSEGRRTAMDTESSAVWTCSMHPHIRLPKPGDCPICGMDLIQVADTTPDTGGHQVFTMSEAAKKLAEVRTSEVKRGRAWKRIDMVGMVFEDETRVAALTSRVGGRLDEVHVDFTGERVEKGDPMVTIWSPTLITTQVELFETMRGADPDEGLLRGAEEKLKQFGLTDAQINEIKVKQRPMLYVTLRAPISGIVMERRALLGHFVDEGTVMYQITDLSKVWVKMDAYESDLPWIRYGQDVTFTTPAIPGKRFVGRVVFIEPVLRMDTRSVKVRVEVDNPELLLKPHMFVSAELRAELDATGRVVKPEWAGKYICPRHPDSISDEPGPCPEGDGLRKPATAFGYAPDDFERPLLIPETAPLFTGKRSVVYVEVPGAKEPAYELRKVTLGPKAGTSYIVIDGLRQGERVVTHGNFKIDSAMQILARPSMMNPPEDSEAESADHAAAHAGHDDAKHDHGEKEKSPHTGNVDEDHTDHGTMKPSSHGSSSKGVPRPEASERDHAPAAEPDNLRQSSGHDHGGPQ